MSKPRLYCGVGISLLGMFIMWGQSAVPWFFHLAIVLFVWGGVLNGVARAVTGIERRPNEFRTGIFRPLTIETLYRVDPGRLRATHPPATGSDVGKWQPAAI